MTSGGQSTVGATTASRCARCGAELRPGARFCAACGATATAQTAAPAVAQPPASAPAACPTCGKQLAASARFCTGCGTPVEPAAARGAPTPGRDAAAHAGSLDAHGGAATGGPLGGLTRDAGRLPGTAGGWLDPTRTGGAAGGAGAGGSTPAGFEARGGMVGPGAAGADGWPAPPPPRRRPPPPPPRADLDFGQFGSVITVGRQLVGGLGGAGPTGGATGGSGSAHTTGPGGAGATPIVVGAVPLPPAPPPWPFQAQTTELAARAVAQIDAAGLPTQRDPGRLVARLVRAALVDERIYREVAVEPGLQSEALKVVAITFLARSLGSVLTALTAFSISYLVYLVVTAAVAALAWFAGVWAIQFAAQHWLKRPVPLPPLFRALAYAQAPTCLQWVPVVGPILALWTLVTNAAAIRDVIGCDTVRAAVLSVVGVVGAMIAVAVIGPLLLPFFLRF